MMIRLRRCAGWLAPYFLHATVRISRVEAHIWYMLAQHKEVDHKTSFKSLTYLNGTLITVNWIGQYTYHHNKVKVTTQIDPGMQASVITL